jgi:hypothetical protein
MTRSPAIPRSTVIPNDSKRSATNAAVLCSSNAVSGWAWDLVAPFRHLGMKFCDAINYRHWRASLPEATAAWRAKRLPVNRSSLSRVVARRVLFPLFAKHARHGEGLESTIVVLFATAEIASGFAKRPSSKAHSNTRQRSVGQDAQPSQPSRSSWLLPSKNRSESSSVS